LALWAVGVGHVFIRAGRNAPPAIPSAIPSDNTPESTSSRSCNIAPSDLHPFTVGVGHCLRPTTVSRFGNLSAHADSGVIVAAIAEQLRGVGQVSKYPDSFPLVGRSGVASSKHTPLRIIPHRGQVSKDDSKSANSEHWRVFHEDVTGLNFANHSCHFSPQSAFFSADSGPFSGAGNVLTRESTRDDFDKSSPRLSVECFNILKDGKPRKKTVFLPSV
jgi:hypothetical protein